MRLVKQQLQALKAAGTASAFVVPNRKLTRLSELEAALGSMEAEMALSDFQKKGGKTMKEIKQELEMD